MKLVVELDGEMISRINLLRRRDRQSVSETLTKAIVVPGKSEVYLLYWYKSTNTDADAHARKTVASVTCTTIWRRKRLNKADDCTAA